MRRGNNKFAKKAMCWILSLAMVLVFIPFSSFAADSSADDAEANGILLDQINLLNSYVPGYVEAYEFWNSVLTSAGAHAAVLNKANAGNLEEFLKGLKSTDEIWTQWNKWGQYISQELPENLLFWPGIKNFEGVTLPVGQFSEIGEEAMQALASMLLFVPEAAKEAIQIPEFLTNNVKTWNQLKSLIEDLELPSFEMPEVTLPDIETIMSLYPDIDWTKVFEDIDFTPSEFGFNKITGEWTEIPFDVLMDLLSAVSELGTDIDLNKILPTWDWQGDFPVVDWSAVDFDDWGDLLNLDFMDYLKNLEFPVDDLEFDLNLPTFEKEITGVSAEPVKSNDNALHNGVLEDLAKFDLADEDGFVDLDEDGNAKVLYKVTVSGTPGSTYTLEGEDCQLVFAPLNAFGVPTATQLPDGTIKGYIPYTHTASGDVTLFVSKDYDEDDVKDADEYSKYDYLPLDFSVKSNTAEVNLDSEAPEGMAYVVGDTAKLIYDTNGGTPEYDYDVVKEGADVTINKYPFRAGYTFTGWYLDEDCKTLVKDNIVTIDGNTTLYAGWTETPVPEWLNGEDHFAYLMGYEDGYIKPGKSITRAEVATIFFRLLKDDYRTKYMTKSNSFSDVKSSAWYNTAVSTLASMGIVNGRTATEFAPNEEITRAEFVTICARFDKTVNEGASNLSDVDNNWAKDYINKSYTLGWINGYTDMTFVPNKSITRAEVATIVNRILHRLPDEQSDLLSTMKTWPDNRTSDWYYLAIQEATNSHVAEYDTETTEVWTALEKNIDWTKYEK